jgi:hypothetical protein
MNELKGTTIEWSPDLWIRDASTQDYLQRNKKTKVSFKDIVQIVNATLSAADEEIHSTNNPQRKEALINQKRTTVNASARFITIGIVSLECAISCFGIPCNVTATTRYVCIRERIRARSFGVETKGNERSRRCPSRHSSTTCGHVKIERLGHCQSPHSFCQPQHHLGRIRTTKRFKNCRTYVFCTCRVSLVVAHTHTHTQRERETTKQQHALVSCF